MLFFTNPLAIKDIPANDAHKSKDGRISYEFIVLHHTNGKNSRAWLSTTSSPPVSTHRLIERDGTNVKIVSDEQIAYTQGYSYLGGRGYYQTLNNRSLSIEFEHLVGEDYPIAQLTMGAKQVVEWYGKYGFMSILYHLMIDPEKTDPERFPRLVFDTLIRDELKKYL